MRVDQPLPTTRSPAWLLALLSAAIGTMVALAAGELLVRWLNPQATMVPRSRFSAAYGLEFHPNRTMVHELSGRWRFEYTTNGVVIINGKPLLESYTKTTVPWEVAPAALGPNEYYVMGDNRAVSVLGPIDRKTIIGKVVF